MQNVLNTFYRIMSLPPAWPYLHDRIPPVSCTMDEPSGAGTDVIGSSLFPVFGLPVLGLSPTGTMGREVQSLIALFGQDHAHGIALTSLITGELPDSPDDF